MPVCNGIGYGRSPCHRSIAHVPSAQGVKRPFAPKLAQGAASLVVAEES